VNETLHFVCVALFLVSAPLLLASRALRPKLMSWWFVLALSAGLGWILLMLANSFYRSAFYEENPMALVTWWDPTPRWGWLGGLLYLTLWLGPYWVIIARRRRLDTHREPAA
jgi:hypothetical protein